MNDLSNKLYLDAHEVQQRFSISRATLNRRRKTDPTFPEPTPLSSRKNLWEAAAIERWLKGLTPSMETPEPETKSPPKRRAGRPVKLPVRQQA